MPARPVSLSRLTVVLLWSAWLLCACSPVAVQQAQHALAVADSLPPEALSAADSTALASAVTTLRHRRFSFPDDYARACYRYGRLLRLRGDYPAAMQAFIGATRAPYLIRPIPLPGFTDYASLARAYSNMGSLCLLASEHRLSYDMYARAADCFLAAGDSLYYYYAEYSMAYQQAELCHRDSTLALVEDIVSHTSDDYTYWLTRLTMAKLCLNMHRYDSSLFYIDQTPPPYRTTALFAVAKAQAYWNLMHFDSALCYAKQVMTLPDASDNDRYNMLYIMTYNDSTLSKDEVRRLAEERADIDRELLDPLSLQYTKAVQLLESESPNESRRLYIMLACLLVGMAYAGWACYLHKRRKTLNRYQQDLTNRDELLQQRETSLQEQYLNRREETLRQIEANCELLGSSANWQQDLAWKDYEKMCAAVNNSFNLLAHKLKATNCLGERDIRLCVLVLIGTFSDKQLADILYYGENSIRGMKRYTAGKLGTTTAHLRQFLLEMAADIS